MKELDRGHLFQLDTLDGDVELHLQFVKRVGEGYPGNEEPAYPGCTSQEVIRALIMRCHYVNAQSPDYRNDIALTGLRTALRAFEQRAADRRGELDEFCAYVNGTDQAIELLPTCRTCGHVGCGKHP